MFKILSAPRKPIEWKHTALLFCWIISFAEAADGVSPVAENELRFSYEFPHGFTYASCRSNDPLGVTVPIDRNGKFHKPCAPDTLYSWQDEAKVAEWLKSSTPEKILPIPYLYLWRTPMGTFAYGKVGMRIKLRRKAYFVRIDHPIKYPPDCTLLAMKFGRDAPNVYVNVHDYEGAPKSISEYLICSSAPVESWSVGQPLFLEEMEREIEWIQTHTPDQYDLYIPLQGAIPWKHTTIDAGWFADSWTEKTLLERLEDTRTRTPEIRLRGDSAQTLEEHFTTSVPVYFNPGMPRPPRPVIKEVAKEIEAVEETIKKVTPKPRRKPRYRPRKKPITIPSVSTLALFSWDLYYDSFTLFIQNLLNQTPNENRPPHPND